MFATLDQAIVSLSSPTPTTYFWKQLGRTPFSSQYFSQICGNLLTFGSIRLTANQLRHLFVTGWNDFMNDPSTYLAREYINQANLAASALMQNHPNVWAHYDDSSIDRNVPMSIALWPKFQKFMHEQHLDFAAKKPWNPLDTPLSSLRPT